MESLPLLPAVRGGQHDGWPATTNKLVCDSIADRTQPQDACAQRNAGNMLVNKRCHHALRGHPTLCFVWQMHGVRCKAAGDFASSTKGTCCSTARQLHCKTNKHVCRVQAPSCIRTSAKTQHARCLGMCSTLRHMRCHLRQGIISTTTATAAGRPYPVCKTARLLHLTAHAVACPFEKQNIKGEVSMHHNLSQHHRPSQHSHHAQHAHTSQQTANSSDTCALHTSGLALTA